MRPFLLVTAAISAVTYAFRAHRDKGLSLTPVPAYERLDKTDVVLVITDYQEGLIGLVKDFDTALYRNNMLAYSGLAQVFDLPVIIASSGPTGPNGMVPKELLPMHSNATIVDRSGETNAWDSEEFREVVRTSGKSQVIVAGISADVCTAVLALFLREEGYSVWANTGALGTTSAFERDLGNQRMMHAGVQVLSTLSLMTELMRSWAATPGAKELLPWVDMYVPQLGFIVRAHGHAIQSGVLVPGEEAIP